MFGSIYLNLCCLVYLYITFIKHKYDSLFFNSAYSFVRYFVCWWINAIHIITSQNILMIHYLLTSQFYLWTKTLWYKCITQTPYNTFTIPVYLWCYHFRSACLWLKSILIMIHNEKLFPRIKSFTFTTINY